MDKAQPSELVELKPCPFCDRAASFVQFPLSETPWFVTVDHAEDCELRCADGHRLCHATEAEAATSWNHRPHEEEYEQTFDLHWKAQMRAVARWREANPGNDLVLPDHADLVEWLIERLTPTPEPCRLREALDAFNAAEIAGLKPTEYVVLHLPFDAVEKIRTALSASPAEPEEATENRELRQIIASLGYCTPDASLEFMRMIPAEIAAMRSAALPTEHGGSDE